MICDLYYTTIGLYDYEILHTLSHDAVWSAGSFSFVVALLFFLLRIS